MFRPVPTPEDMLIEITAECNHACVHCSARGGEKRNDELTTSEFKAKVLDAGHELGVKAVVLSGGEPLMRKEALLELALHCTATLGMTCYVVTNASFITRETAIELKEANVRKVWVSMYASKPEIHEAVTGIPTSWEATMRGISVLLDEGVNTGFNTVVMQHNYKDLPNLVELAKKIGIDPGSESTPNAEPAISVFRISPAGRGRDNFRQLRLTPEQRSEFAVAMRKAAKREGMVVLPAGWAATRAFPELLTENLKKPICGSVEHCPAGRVKLYVNPVGDVYPCAPLADYFLRAGNVREQELKEIWTKAPVFQLCRYVSDNPPFPCNECAKFVTCRGGECRAERWYDYGDLTIPDPSCSIVAAQMR